MSVLSVIPSIDIIFGPMFSGKTSEIIRRLNIYYEMGMKVIYINSQKDNRSEYNFSSHNSTIGLLPFDTVKLVELDECKIQNYDVIGIDESQMFQNLKNTVLNWVEKHNKIVIVAGLNGDFQRENFGEINSLIPYCDSISKLTPFCISCKKEKNKITPALFTKRICKDNISIILIGGKETYIPVCRSCFK